MTQLNANTRLAISGGGECWKVAEASNEPSTVEERDVALEIAGDDESGYHLAMSPEGCFTADTWHPTVADAIATAARMFDVPASTWQASPRGESDRRT